MSGDALSIAPDTYSLVLENDRVRVLEVRTPPGGMSEMHSHPDTVVISVTGPTHRFSHPGDDPLEMDIPDASAVYMDTVEHSVENVGHGAGHGFIIELK